MAKDIIDYKITKIEEGWFDYSTLFVNVEEVEYQIPFNKSLKFEIGQEIAIDNLFTPIEK
jgi:hypothetical protein